MAGNKHRPLPGVILPGDRYVTSAVKRLGEDWSFSEAFVVFVAFLLFFHVFCLVLLINFVYLHTVKGVATICSP